MTLVPGKYTAHPANCKLEIRTQLSLENRLAKLSGRQNYFGGELTLDLFQLVEIVAATEVTKIGFCQGEEAHVSAGRQTLAQANTTRQHPP